MEMLSSCRAPRRIDRIRGRYSGKEKIRSLNLDGGRYPARQPVADSLSAAKVLFVAEKLGDPCWATEPRNRHAVGFNPGCLIHARIKHYVYSDCKRAV
ncbi:TPA: hypothetical protein QDA83_005324 [Burkholderia multivorans]|uniref:hypothetical protein n=1 Tax=Burkholderia multivorans TaxID=87883 RepID=UPI0015919D9F|nr:hypothetical protein [Burkholderia multivorans]MBU9572177.1 hypothetical protein [Burkholderia multivorans]MBU9622951.1 hypothetical protein [Burkholderia multivorans]MBU9650644.1 hypothetical protein [Burkholderia multivorans]HDR8916820.1 hypothetical protein [Burkholderia multivorans]